MEVKSAGKSDRMGKVSWKSPPLFGTGCAQHRGEAEAAHIRLAAFAPKLGVVQICELGSHFDKSW